MDFLLEGLQEFPTLKQIISLHIGLKCITSDYNQGPIIQELRTRGRRCRFPLVGESNSVTPLSLPKFGRLGECDSSRRAGACSELWHYSGFPRVRVDAFASSEMNRTLNVALSAAVAKAGFQVLDVRQEKQVSCQWTWSEFTTVAKRMLREVNALSTWEASHNHLWPFSSRSMQLCNFQKREVARPTRLTRLACN